MKWRYIRMRKPNLLLITVDQMRGDCLGIEGRSIVETPHLDMMAQGGVRFTHAYSAVPSCIAARAAIMTGMSQKAHGRVGYLDGVDWNYEHTLASTLAENGYHTYCVGKMHVHPERNLCGFHNVELHDGYLHYHRNHNKPVTESSQHCDDYLVWLRNKLGPQADIIDTGIDCNSWVARPWIYEEYLHPTNWVVNQSIDFLRRKDPTKPFFLMMSFVRPHSPLDPPQVYFDQYIHEDIPMPPIGDWVEEENLEAKGKDVNCIQGLISPKALKRARAAYYGSITHIDHQIGRFLKTMHEYGHLKDTVIVFTSDHGDLLGDHHFFRKALGYEGSCRVPFIVYDPGNMLKIQKGLKAEEVVELRDIMPTLLEIAGVFIPPTVEGKSTVPILQGKKDVPWRDYIHGEHSFGLLSNHYITNGKEKYIWYSQTGVEQYFDLSIDSEEKRNLIEDSSYEARIKLWRQCLIKELEGREEGYTDGEKLIIGQQPVDVLSHLMRS